MNDLLSECAEIGCHKLTQADYCGVHSAERRRRSRIASGVCARCGEQPIDLAYESYCEECARKHRSDQRRQYAR